MIVQHCEQISVDAAAPIIERGPQGAAVVGADRVTKCRSGPTRIQRRYDLASSLETSPYQVEI